MKQKLRITLAGLCACLLHATVLADQPGWESTKEYFVQAVGNVTLFTRNSNELSERAKAGLDAQLVWLKDHPEFDVDLLGYADDSKNAAQNLELAERRASKVKFYMATKGLDVRRVFVVPRGNQFDFLKEEGGGVLRKSVLSALKPRL